MYDTQNGSACVGKEVHVLFLQLSPEVWTNPLKLFYLRLQPVNEILVEEQLKNNR